MEENLGVGSRPAYRLFSLFHHLTKAVVVYSIHPFGLYETKELEFYYFL